MPETRRGPPHSNKPGKPQIAKKIGIWVLGLEGLRGSTPATELPSVVTETVTGTGVEPESVTELDEREQIEPVGAPLQASATV